MIRYSNLALTGQVTNFLLTQTQPPGHLPKPPFRARVRAFVHQAPSRGIAHRAASRVRCTLESCCRTNAVRGGGADVPSHGHQHVLFPTSVPAQYVGNQPEQNSYLIGSDLYFHFHAFMDPCISGEVSSPHCVLIFP